MSSKNLARLTRLRELIDDEAPTDGLHNEAVQMLYKSGGVCPRYLGCTSEGSGDSSYRDNPDFGLADTLDDLGAWCAASYSEGWCVNWVHDLATGTPLNWTVAVALS